ncbi:MAG: PEP-CTERM sorting domain-containing protein [Proteobacteria bacterium]|nr:PEP-CTERM sorting domain-containing protein [Pseudomonadota bacterium]
MEKKKRSFLAMFASIAIVLGLVFMASSAQATSFDLDTEFSGAQEPEGAGPWLNASFVDDGAGTVTLTMSDLNLTDNEFVGSWYFNVDTSVLPSDLQITHVGGVQGSVATTDLNNDSDSTNNNAQFKADGDGFFDIRFDWANGEFGAGDTSVYEISCGSCMLTASSFDFMSEPGGNNGTYNTAAHVQGIGINDQDSGWIGNTVIPEPSTYLLLGSGMLGLAFWRKRRSNR